MIPLSLACTDQLKGLKLSLPGDFHCDLNRLSIKPASYEISVYQLNFLIIHLTYFLLHLTPHMDSHVWCFS